MSLGSS